jgi:hypothetical protein
MMKDNMTSNSHLTRKQRRLLKELEDLTELFGLDYANIHEYEPEARSPVLEVMKDKLVRAQVIMWYTLVVVHARR